MVYRWWTTPIGRRSSCAVRSTCACWPLLAEEPAHGYEPVRRLDDAGIEGIGYGTGLARC